MTYPSRNACLYPLSALFILTGCGSTPSSTPKSASPPQVPQIPNQPTFPIASWSSQGTINSYELLSDKEQSARPKQSWLTGNDGMNGEYAGIMAPSAGRMGSGDGTGVRVGVLDSGADHLHPALAERITARQNFVAGHVGTDISDYTGHGTHVAAILAGSLQAEASRVRGVAPGAHLAVGKIGGSGNIDLSVLQNGFTWLTDIQKTPIINLSMGADRRLSAPNVLALERTVRSAIEKGPLLVVAAGNDGQRFAVSYPAAFAGKAWAQGRIMVVGALTTDTGHNPTSSGDPPVANLRAHFSNYDPELAAFTVYAPGMKIYSARSQLSEDTATPDDPLHATLSGTSMATPMVAGQAAVIKSNWQFLPGQDIAQIIFQTASRRCSDGSELNVCTAKTTPDPEFGWGIIDVKRSLQPIGALVLATPSGARIRDGFGSGLATPRSGMASGLTGIQSMALDQFKRGYKVSLSNPQAANGTSLTALPGLPGRVPHAGTASGAFALTRHGLQVVQLAHRKAVGAGLEVGFKGASGRFFGLQHSITGWQNPFLDLVGQRVGTLAATAGSTAMHAGYAGQWQALAGQPLQWRVALVAAQPGQLQRSSRAVHRSLAMAELASHHGPWDYAASVGRLAETNAILGLTGNGAMAIASDTHTHLLNLAGAYRAGPQSALEAQVALGHTSATRNTAQSLISGTSASQSLAWSLGWERKQLLSGRDQLRVIASMPLRTMNGTLAYSTADTQDAQTGALRFTDKTASLAPKGIERNLALHYSYAFAADRQSLWSHCALDARTHFRWESQHNADAPRAWGVGVGLRKNF